MWISITFYTLLSLFIFTSLVLILLVLIQKGRGGGLASAFGGMGGNTAFGSKTGDVLTWTTAIVFGVFLSLAILLNWTAAARHNARTQIASQTVQPAAATGATGLPAVEPPTTNPAAPAPQPLLNDNATPAIPPSANPVPTTPPTGAAPANSPTTPAPTPSAPTGTP